MATGLKLLVLAAVFLSGCAGVQRTEAARAPQTEEEKLAVAREISTILNDTDRSNEANLILEAMTGPADLCQFADTPESKELCLKEAPVLYAELKAATEVYRDDIKASMPDLIEAFAKLMVRDFTAEELAAMHAFYTSPAGQSVMKKRDKVFAEFDRFAEARIQSAKDAYDRAIQRPSDRLRAIFEAELAKPPSRN